MGYWYPLIPFITLCLQPTMVMCLNHKLEMVKIDVESRERNKSRFDYVENLKEEKKGKRKKAIKVELSVAAKTKQRQKKKEEETETEESADSEKKEKMEVDESESKEKEKGKEEEAKKSSKYNVLTNPSRVTPNQVQYVQWTDERYRPLTTRFQGFVMVEDTKPEEEVELVEQKEIASGGVYGDEPPAQTLS